MRWLVTNRPTIAENIQYYTLVGLPGNPEVPIVENAGSQYGLKYDISALPAGSYRVKISACNSNKCSQPSIVNFVIGVDPSIPVDARVI